MNTDYTKYKAEDLLEDDFFIQSNLSPTLETINFWKKQVTAGILDEREYNLALFYLDSLKVKKAEFTSDRQELVWERIVSANKIYRLNKSHRFRSFIWVAACLAILVLSSISYLYFTQPQNDTLDIEKFALSMDSEIKTNEIQLKLSDRQIPINGQNSVIEHNSEGTVRVNSEKIAEIPVEPSISPDTPVEFNQLTVPSGKRSSLIFEDGTRLWVNAASRVIYPSTFADDKREIYVDGEIFLEVTPDEKRPFVVKTNDMNVTVLGTSFNVMSYTKDSTSAVVLVSGLVEIGIKNKETVQLTPNNILSYQRGSVDIQKVDVDDYILWREGLYTYKSEKFSVILNRLSRYYGTHIKYSPEVAELRCSGKLDMQDELESILDGLSQTVPVKYEIEGEKFVLSKSGK